MTLPKKIKKIKIKSSGDQSEFVWFTSGLRDLIGLVLSLYVACLHLSVSMVAVIVIRYI